MKIVTFAQYPMDTVAELVPSYADINESISMYPMGHNTGYVNVVFTPTEELNLPNAFAFCVQPDEGVDYTTYTGAMVIVNELLVAVLNHEWDGPFNIPANEYSNVLKLINIAAGKLAAVVAENPQWKTETESVEEDLSQPPHADPNMMYYQLLNGQLMMTDKRTVDWAENIENLASLHNTVVNIQHAIFDLCYKSKEEQEGVIDRVNTMLNQFYQAHGMTPDYHVFEGKVSERELAMIKLVDMMTIYNEIISMTTAIAAQKSITELYVEELRSIRDAVEHPALPEGVTLRATETDEDPPTLEEYTGETFSDADSCQSTEE